MQFKKTGTINYSVFVASSLTISESSQLNREKRKPGDEAKFMHHFILEIQV